MDAYEIIKNLNFRGFGKLDLYYVALKDALHAHNSEGSDQESWMLRSEKINAWEEKVGIGTARLLMHFIGAAGLLEKDSCPYGGWLNEDGLKVLKFLNDFGTNPENWERYETHTRRSL